MFYNAEKETFWYRPEDNLRDAGSSLFVEGFNLALNLLYRFTGWGSPRLFAQVRYAPSQNSAMLVPGFRLSPWSHIDVYLAIPMALGGKNGYYYNNTEDAKNRPFSVMLFVTLKGSVQAGYYY